MNFFTRYKPPIRFLSKVGGMSRTRQEFARECDINVIISKLGAGILAPLEPPEPLYADLDSVPRTYEESFAIIEQASNKFATLPARLREKFGNDPAKLLAFLADKSNRDEAISLGLIDKPIEDPVTPPALSNPRASSNPPAKE